MRVQLRANRMLEDVDIRLRLRVGVRVLCCDMHTCRTIEQKMKNMNLKSCGKYEVG